VGFRYTAAQKASGWGLTGWVRNLADGSVEAHCEGSREDLERFLHWAAGGPPGAFVRSLEKRWCPASGVYSRFSIEY